MFRIFKAIWRGMRPQKKPLHPFKRGDVVRLKHRNPFKGTLSADGNYTVIDVSIMHWICIRADNFTKPWLDIECFELASNPIHKGTTNRWTHDWQEKRQQFLAKKRSKRWERRARLDHCNAKAEEYEQAIKAQEMIGDVL